jgi:tetratricopeptide (TPR) repeat protein
MPTRFILQIAAVVVACLAAGSVSGALAAGFDTTPAINAEDKNFDKGKKAIDAKKWNDAIEAFKKVVADNADNADAHNYLGYAYRWTNKMDESFKHYNIALKLSPNHRGAHEYIGVAYLKVNQPEKAKEHLAKLEKICGKKCEEYEDLAKALAAYQPAKK